MRVLVIEDEKNLNNVICKKLLSQGHVVDSCLDGISGWDYIESTGYDIILLDLMLPGLSGMDILEKTRKKKITTPVLILTAKDSIDDRVSGLNLGADDYLTKPFAFEELLARIKVLLRRKSTDSTNVSFIDDLSIDFDSHQVKRRGDLIELSSKEFSILEYLVRNKGIILSKEKIEDHIWGYDYQGDSNMVTVYIRYLRQKIDIPYDEKLIHTIRGAGYVIKEKV